LACCPAWCCRLDLRSGSSGRSVAVGERAHRGYLFTGGTAVARPGLGRGIRRDALIAAARSRAWLSFGMRSRRVPPWRVVAQEGSAQLEVALLLPPMRGSFVGRQGRAG
jgi:hypothetical protein